MSNDTSTGWLQDGPLLYRLTEDRHPVNRDEINITMASGSRDLGDRAARATSLRLMLTTPGPGATADLLQALDNARMAIESMKQSAETAGAGGDEQMLQEACESISNEGLEASEAIRAELKKWGRP